MPDNVRAIARVRDSVAAIVRVNRTGTTDSAGNAVFGIKIVGTAFCVVANRMFVTANHVFNDTKPRDPQDTFYMIAAPNNGSKLFWFPVTTFVMEDANLDIAVIEAPVVPGIAMKRLLVTFTHQPDGTPVLTYGCPAPVIASAAVDAQGRLTQAQTHLFTHANCGIVSASYDAAGAWLYEFNVGWHHGESGGPVCAYEPFAVFALMQGYRKVQTPDATIPGPHLGKSLSAIEKNLRAIGANVV